MKAYGRTKLQRASVYLCGTLWLNHRHGMANLPCTCGSVAGIYREEIGDNLYLNPESISIPKQDSRHSYMMLNDDVSLWKDMDGTVYHDYRL